MIKKYINSGIYYGELNSEKKREGRGIMIYFSGKIYEGSWKNNERQG